MPAWLPGVEAQLAERLAQLNVAEVDIQVEPAGVDVRLAVASNPDELFEPRKIHLAPGRHVVLASASGYRDAQRTIDIVDKTPQSVTITLLPNETPRPDRGSETAHSKVPWLVAGGGAALLAAGVVYHLVWLKPAADNLSAAAKTAMPDAAPAAYDEWSHRYDVRRGATFALYGAAAVTVGVAVVLRFTVYKRSESEMHVSAAPIEGGGLVSLGWTTP